LINTVATNTFTYTATATTTNSASVGKASAYSVSGSYVDNDNISRNLGDAFSLIQFPKGQLAMSRTDGKLYRNGTTSLTGVTSPWDNKWTRAATDAIDVGPGGTVSITADLITTGTLNAANVSVTNLDAVSITAGTLTLGGLNATAISSSNFTVTNTGAITATSANISGAITATSGAIGGYILASDRLTNNGGGTAQVSGLIDTAGTGLAFFAGATDTAGTAAKFTVSNAGAVGASSLTITGGTITLGSFFSVDVSGYINAKTAKFSPGSGTVSSGQPALLLAGSSATGDIAVTSGSSINIGHTTAVQGTNGAFTERVRIDANGNVRIYDGYLALGSTDVFAVTAAGIVTADGDIRTNGSLVSYGADVFIDQNGTETPAITFRNDGGGTTYGVIGHNATLFTFSDAVSITGSLAVSSTLTVSSAITGTSSLTIGALGGIYFGTTTADPNLYYSSTQWRFTDTGTGTGAIDAVWTVNGTGATALVRGSVSARKYKENIVEQAFNLDDVFSLRPVTYDMKDEYLDKDEDGNPVGLKGPHLGVIADEAVGNGAWERLVVRSADTGEVDMFNYKIMAVVLLDAGKQMYEKIKSLEARVAELES
jgi:hypothetical protein